MVQAYSRIFGNMKPVFDGRSNLYVKDPLPIGNDQVIDSQIWLVDSTKYWYLIGWLYSMLISDWLISKYWSLIGCWQVELEVTLDSEGRDRVFRVTIKWVAQVRYCDIIDADDADH